TLPPLRELLPGGLPHPTGWPDGLGAEFSLACCKLGDSLVQHRALRRTGPVLTRTEKAREVHKRLVHLCEIGGVIRHIGPHTDLPFGVPQEVVKVLGQERICIMQRHRPVPTRFSILRRSAPVSRIPTGSTLSRYAGLPHTPQ